VSAARKRKAQAPPEESLAARAAVLAAMLVALVGVAVTASLPFSAALCAVAVAAGHRASWRGRHRPRTPMGQIALGGALAAGMIYLFLDLFGGTFGGDLPQAHFTLIAAACTAFDLKSRRNLFSHLWHSLVILYIAGLFAWSSVFVFAVIAWGACMVTFFAATRARPVTGGRVQATRWGRMWPVAAIWLLVAVGVFIAMPELPGRPLATPVLLNVPNFSAHGESLPAALPVVGTSPAPGGGAIDLRARGRFGDEVAFHVRANGGGYWRAYSLETYSGAQWDHGDFEPKPVPAMGGKVSPREEPAYSTDQTLTQTFFMDTSLPSELIGVYPITETYYPGFDVRTLPDGTVEAPSPLSSGSSYGLVSRIRDTSPARLRAAQPLSLDFTDPGETDVLLPPSVTDRTRTIAHQLTAGQATEYDKVVALQQWLQTHEQYSLDTPRLQGGNDAVDQFLFIDHLGFCEQFSSALAVMLRSQGIPARLAIGYASSERDLLTGTYTVRNRDAHAWTEVLFPGVGWVPFDASPGYDATPKSSASSSSFLSLDSLVKLGGVPGGAQVVGIVIAGAAVIIAILAWGRRRRRRAGMHPTLRRYADELRRLRRRKLPGRDPTETVAEHLQRLEAASPPAADELRPLAAAVEELLYEA
jgi:transglutaminase-like putative cysteine protease